MNLDPVEYEARLRASLTNVTSVDDVDGPGLLRRIKPRNGPTYSVFQPWIVGADGSVDIAATKDAFVALCLADLHNPGVLTKQPAPAASTGDIWRDILDDLRGSRDVSPELLGLMEARRVQGIAKHGTPLQVGNLRDARADAIQEVLDGIACAEVRRQERANEGDVAGACAWLFIREDMQRVAQRMLELP